MRKIKFHKFKVYIIDLFIVLFKIYRTIALSSAFNICGKWKNFLRRYYLNKSFSKTEGLEYVCGMNHVVRVTRQTGRNRQSLALERGRWGTIVKNFLNK